MRKEKSFKIAKTTLEAAIGVVVVLFVALFIMSKVSSSPIFLFNKTTMWVMTESMDPTIPPKTYILVEEISADEVEVGDVIVFKSTDPRISGQYNTHRVIEKNGNAFVTKGDNNPIDDGEYSAKAENIVGRHVKTLPVLTFIGRVAISPVGFAVLIILLIITMAFCVIPDIKEAMALKAKESEEEKEREKQRIFDEEMRRLKKNAGNDDTER